VIIADEALASLDMSMRSQLINLMLELQEKQGSRISTSPSIWE
jgi:cationic peptide transport system ATP-binding protein